MVSVSRTRRAPCSSLCAAHARTSHGLGGNLLNVAKYRRFQSIQRVWETINNSLPFFCLVWLSLLCPSSPSHVSPLSTCLLQAQCLETHQSHQSLDLLSLSHRNKVLTAVPTTLSQPGILYFDCIRNPFVGSLPAVASHGPLK